MIHLLRAIGRTKYVLAIIDFVTLFIVAFIIVTGRVGSNHIIERGLDDLVFFLISSMIAIIIFRELSLYKHKLYSAISDQIVALSKSFLWLAVIQAVGLFLIKDPEIFDYSRSLIGFYIISGLVVLAGLRVVVIRPILSRRGMQSDEPATRSALIVGAGLAGQGLAARFFGIPELGVTLVGFLDDDKAKIGMKLLGKPILGSITSVAEIARQQGVQEIFIAINSIAYDRLLQIIDECRRTELPVTVTTEHFRIVHDKIGTSEFRIIDSMTLRPRAFTSVRWVVKRLFDFVGGVILLILLSPLFLLISLLIKATSSGPVFYKTSVVGKGGRLFTWHKFRTMYSGRDETVHREHLKNIITANASTEKLQNDPRITTIGRFLRRHSIDELPQLFSVVRGDMSLIGPRPCLPYEYEHYSDWHKKRFYVVPGMTGLWQILGRNNTGVTFNDSMILDLYYVQNHSLWLDLKILLRTIPAVLFGRGGS